jgi:hypothetical protein
MAPGIPKKLVNLPTKLLPLEPLRDARTPANR